MFFIAVLNILLKLQVKWDGVQTPTWVKYQNVEILCDFATVPLIRVPSATISPEIFEERKITTQNYETRGTSNCWCAY